MLSYHRAVKKWNQDGAEQGRKVQLGNVWAIPRRGTFEQEQVAMIRRGEELPRPRPEGKAIPESVRRNNAPMKQPSLGAYIQGMRRKA